MPNLNPHAAGSVRNSTWWVVQQFSGGRGSVPFYMAVQSNTKPQNAIAGPFTSQNAATKVANAKNGGGINLPSIPNPGNIVQGWLSSAGADIGSGIETGIVQMLKDVWNVIWGPVEVGLGLIIIVFTLFFYFGGSMGQLGALMA